MGADGYLMPSRPRRQTGLKRSIGSATRANSHRLPARRSGQRGGAPSRTGRPCSSAAPTRFVALAAVDCADVLERGDRAVLGEQPRCRHAISNLCRARSRGTSRSHPPSTRRSTTPEPASSRTRRRADRIGRTLSTLRFMGHRQARRQRRHHPSPPFLDQPADRAATQPAATPAVRALIEPRIELQMDVQIARERATRLTGALQEILQTARRHHWPADRPARRPASRRAAATQNRRTRAWPADLANPTKPRTNATAGVPPIAPPRPHGPPELACADQPRLRRPRGVRGLVSPIADHLRPGRAGPQNASTRAARTRTRRFWGPAGTRARGERRSGSPSGLASAPHTATTRGCIFNRRSWWPTFRPALLAYFSTGLDKGSPAAGRYQPTAASK
jgi:hypothetical protein